ncbi:hypothetical protein Poly30_08170 [Planctomycetes bacterium Poly30]|uniref:Protein SirB1 N-terminal domain-containing protein n=1 Tax=Saltatorellus ferox TaxID=2528018 RepID=A0A518EMN4_9BACT|nr:hypothetical protein Poly30_08170 [Planctomycetes bacterium Poly30]
MSVIRRSSAPAWVLLLGIACSGDPQSSLPEPVPGRGATNVEALLALTAADLDVGRAALLLGREVDPDVDLERLDRRLDTLAAEVVRGARRASSMEERLQALVGVLRSQGFYYDEQQNRLDVLLENSIGNCVAFSTLYLAVGQRAGLDLRTRLAPSHQYVEFTDGTRSIDIEATSHVGLKEGLGSRLFFFGEDQRELYAQRLDARQWLSTCWSEAVRARRRSGQADGALEHLSVALDLWPDNRDAHMQRAMLLRGADPEAASEAAQAIVVRDPSDADAWALIAECELGAGQVEAARTAVDRALAIDARHPRAWLLSAHVALEEGSAERALACIEKSEKVPLIQLHPVRLAQHEQRMGGVDYGLLLHDARARAHLARAQELMEEIDEAGDREEVGPPEERLVQLKYHLRAGQLHSLARRVLEDHNGPPGARSESAPAVPAVPEVSEVFEDLPPGLESLAQEVRSLLPPDQQQ